MEWYVTAGGGPPLAPPNYAIAAQLRWGIPILRRGYAGDSRLMPLKAFGVASLFVGASTAAAGASLRVSGIHSKRRKVLNVSGEEIQFPWVKGRIRAQCWFSHSLISSEKEGGYHIEDEIEIPMFNDGDGLSHCHKIASDTLPHSNDRMIGLPAAASISKSNEEKISDDEQRIQKISQPAYRSARKDLGDIWSEANREVEALVWANEKSGYSSLHDVFVNERTSSKGGSGRRKAKPKFVFPLHSHKKDLLSFASDSYRRTSSDDIPLGDEIGATDDGEMDNNMADIQLNIHDKESVQLGNHRVPFEPAYKHDSKGHSMSEFLNCFLEGNNQQGSLEVEIQKRRRVHKVLNKNTSPSGDLILDDDDLPEDFDSESSLQSEDDEEKAQNNKPIIPRSMTDQFQEAFGAASEIDDRLHVAFPMPLCGMYRKLQQVLQSEKERDSSTKIGVKDEGMPILVRILSRSLEAKLIVCSCSFVGNGKDSYWENSLETRMKGIDRTLTIIFNPRICNNDDLEVGNLISLCPPWKEVQVRDEVIFLCSHFAQVQP